MPQNGFVALLRVLRILQTFNLRRNFAVIQARYRDLNKALGILKSILVVAFVWHWTSCAWYFIDYSYFENHPNVDTWMSVKSLNTQGLSIKILDSLLFTMSIATSTGYAEHRIYTDYERLIWIIIIYIGNALFAFGFGLMSSSTRLFPEDVEVEYQFLGY